MALLVSFGELGLVLVVAFKFVEVLHEGHDIGLGASLVCIDTGVVNSSCIKCSWNSLGVLGVLCSGPFFTVVGLVIFHFQVLQNGFVV